MDDLYDRIIPLWQQKIIKSDAELAEVLNSHSIAFAYHSGKIENEHITYHDIREIFEHNGVTSYTGDLRTLLEIRNARDSNEELLSAFNDRARLMNVYTAENFRRQGIAGKMVSMLIEEAWNRGVSEISLDATESGRLLYESLGFVDSEECMVLVRQMTGSSMRQTLCFRRMPGAGSARMFFFTNAGSMHSPVMTDIHLF